MIAGTQCFDFFPRQSTSLREVIHRLCFYWSDHSWNERHDGKILDCQSFRWTCSHSLSALWWITSCANWNRKWRSLTQCFPSRVLNDVITFVEILVWIKLDSSYLLVIFEGGLMFDRIASCVGTLLRNYPWSPSGISTGRTLLFLRVSFLTSVGCPDSPDIISL